MTRTPAQHQLEMRAREDQAYAGRRLAAICAVLDQVCKGLERETAEARIGAIVAPGWKAE